MEHEQAAEDLRVIRRMIEQTHRNAGYAWLFFLIPGLLGIAVSLVCHVLLRTGNAPYIWPVWMAFAAVVFVVQRAVDRRERRVNRARTFVDRAITAVWVTVGVTAALTVYATLIVPGVHEWSSGALMAFLFGGGMFLTGHLAEWRPARLAAVLSWGAGLAMLHRPDDQFLIWAAVFLIGLVVPAFLLRRQLLRSEGPRDDVRAA